MKAGYIYILHFLKPYKHAKHYIGYAESANRLYEHFTGKYTSREPKLLKAAREAGVDFILSKIKENQSNLEIMIDEMKNHVEFIKCKGERKLKNVA